MTAPARVRLPHAHRVGDVARRERQAHPIPWAAVVQTVTAAALLLGLMFGLPLALGALAVAMGMDPLGGLR